MIKKLAENFKRKKEDRKIYRLLNKGYEEKSGEKKAIISTALSLLEEESFLNNPHRNDIVLLIGRDIKEYGISICIKQFVLDSLDDELLLEKIKILSLSNGFLSAQQLSFLLKDLSFYELCLKNEENLIALIELLNKKTIVHNSTHLELAKRLLSAPNAQKRICIYDYLLCHSRGKKDINMVRMITGYNSASKLCSIYSLSLSQKKGLLETDLEEIAVDTMKYFKLDDNDTRLFSCLSLFDCEDPIIKTLKGGEYGKVR